MKIEKIFEKVKGTDIVPELKLHFRQSLIQREKLEDTVARVEFVKQLFDDGTFELQEENILVPLDSLDRPITFYRLGKGTSEEISVEYRFLFMILVCTGADSFFIAHNHPHKLSLPSMADIEASHDIRIRAKLMGFEMVDDIIIGSLEEEDEEEGFTYYSLAEKGHFYE